MFIYKITNLINGKIYIGKTIKLKKRIKEHFACAKRLVESNKVFYRAIRKYGKKNFKIEILCECKNHKGLNKMERFFIKKFKTNIIKYGDEFGYNMTDGGDGGVWWIGKKHKKETKDLMKKKMLGNINGSFRKNFVKVALIDEDGKILKRYKTIKQAAIDNGIKSPGDISSFCRGGQKSFKNGSRFKYLGRKYKSKGSKRE